MKVYLIGAGMGNMGGLTNEAMSALRSAEIIIGSKRLTENEICQNKTIHNSYKAEEIEDFLKGRAEKSAAVLLSGDVGFYSGAKRLLETLKGHSVELIPGISSLSYFCARLKIPWEDVKLLSLHGRQGNPVGCICRYKRVFMLLSGGEDLKELCGKLCRYHMGCVTLHIGERLSYGNERIISAKAEEIKSFDFDSLLVVIAENANAADRSLYGIPDEEFIRGGVPMTKREIRALSIDRLGLNDRAVLYDIGAGTGSVAVEAALKLTEGSVYAIEKKEEAIALIDQNKLKFAADNIIIVRGEAPQAIEDLPTPTHAFIGGSGGKSEEIIKSLFNKNPQIKIVINVIALNTLSQIIDIIDRLSLKADIISVSCAAEKKVGGYRLMEGQNPIYIITLN